MSIGKIVTDIFILCLVGACCAPDRSHLERETVIPKPLSVTRGEGRYVFAPSTVWVVETERQQQIVGQLNELFKKAAGIYIEVKNDTTIKEPGMIRLRTDKSLTTEAYTLQIDPEGIEIGALSEAGFFYATQTLRQMLPPQIESDSKQMGMEWSVPTTVINDQPRFAYRGFMLDVSRFFMPKENVLRLIDYMAMLKINTLHWHLVDDQGWRLEIKSHPRLTEVGAWRVAREEEFPARKGPQEGEPTPVGGFYTQEDVREIVAYAASKSVEIIPEIEMPAHTTSSLAAYPGLVCPIAKRFIGVLPGFEGGDGLAYCAGNDSVFLFLQDVIDEVCELFPSRYIHIGGDEASTENWEQCLLCRDRMKTEKIKEVKDLQGYFVGRMSEYIRSKGKTPMGWDELTKSKIPEDAVIFGWQGMGNNGYKAGERGHRYVMTPARIMYLIRYQGPQWFEPRTYFGNNTLADVYNYEPLKTELTPQVADLLMGTQACLWTEFVNSSQEAEYLIFPRLTAFAEGAWSMPGQRNWEDYLKRLDYLLEHYDFLGIHYARSMFNIDHQVIPGDGMLEVKMSCIRPNAAIHYTLDGSEPTVHSAVYEPGMKLDKSAVLKAVTYMGEKKVGQVLTLDLNFNKATAKTIEGNLKNLDRLVNGLRGSDKQSDSEWCGWLGMDGVFTVDLGKKESIQKVSLGNILNYGMASHAPLSVVISVSDDGEIFSEIVRKDNDAKDLFATGISVEEIVFANLQAESRYVRVEFKNPGKCPEGHVRRGQQSWVHFDEICVE